MKSSNLYEDDQWLIIDKPTSIGTHGARAGDIGLVEWLELHQNRELYTCSRLDKGTSGCVLFAKQREACALAQNIHEEERASKVYRFISDKNIKGKKAKKGWVRNDPIQGKACSTKFKLLESGDGFFLYEAAITRGRTHQIRQHAALSGIPIVGDEEYKGAAFKRLCLHCCELSWPGIGEVVRSALPESFNMLLSGKSGVMLDGVVAFEKRLRSISEVSNCCRLLHRGEVDLPVSIDLYGEYLFISSFSEDVSSEEIKNKLLPLLDYYEGEIDCKGGVVRNNAKNPHLRSLAHNLFYWGSVPDQLLVFEHDLTYLVNLKDAQHVGLFLDQRDSRRKVFKAAQDLRVANLFSFTCSFSLASISGGAEVVFSVDLAESALTRGKDNLAINGLVEAERGKFIQEDVMKWLGRQERKLEKDPSAFTYLDLVICDPPVFASAGKGRVFHVEKKWPELVRQVRRILAKNGKALFANNHRGGNQKKYQGELEKYFRKVTVLSPPMDFPPLSGQPEHVRIFWCEA